MTDPARRFRPRVLVVGALAFALLLRCSRREAPPEPVRDERVSPWVSAPANADVGDDCLDVGSARACFAEGHAKSVEGVVAVPRPLDAAREAALRCSGAGAARRCVARHFGADRFACTDDVCSQLHPRLPDDGEWECSDMSGVVLCHGGLRAAGVTPGPADPAWRCGPRRGHEGERVCVDFAPDRPSGEPWDCRFQYEAGAAPRSCRRGGHGPLGRDCGGGCPFGSVCAAGRCLPLRPAVGCWLDADCGDGARCGFGSCRRAAP